MLFASKKKKVTHMSGRKASKKGTHVHIFVFFVVAVAAAAVVRLDCSAATHKFVLSEEMRKWQDDEL
jgi:hypothetical protein